MTWSGLGFMLDDAFRFVSMRDKPMAAPKGAIPNHRKEPEAPPYNRTVSDARTVRGAPRLIHRSL